MINLDAGPVGFVGTSMLSIYRRWGAFVSVALFPSFVDARPFLAELSLPTDRISASIWESASLAATYLILNLLLCSNKALELRNAIIGVVGPGLAVGTWFGFASELPEPTPTNIAALFLLSRVSVYLSAYDYILPMANSSRAFDTLRMARRQLAKSKGDEDLQVFYSGIVELSEEAESAISREPKLANFINGVVSVLRDTGGLGYPDVVESTAEMFSQIAPNTKHHPVPSKPYGEQTVDATYGEWM